MSVSIFVKAIPTKQLSSGPVGYAFLIASPYQEPRVWVGRETKCTGNRAELLAACRALECLEPGQTITLYSQLEYLVYGAGRFKSRRLKKDPSKVANYDMWCRLDRAASNHKVTWYRPPHNNIYMPLVEERAFESAHKIANPI